MTTAKTPRGIRNNNAGNIEWGSPWQGLRPLTKSVKTSQFAQLLQTWVRML